jgi:hypothetical protein
MNPNLSVVQPVASLYTNCAIPPRLEQTTWNSKMKHET